MVSPFRKDLVDKELSAGADLAAEFGEKDKIAKCFAMKAEVEIRFIPFAASALGVLGPRALAFFKGLLVCAAQCEPVPEAFFRRQQWAALSRALWVGAANIVLTRAPVAAASANKFERPPLITPKTAA